MNPYINKTTLSPHNAATWLQPRPNARGWVSITLHRILVGITWKTWVWQDSMRAVFFLHGFTRCSLDVARYTPNTLILHADTVCHITVTQESRIRPIQMCTIWYNMQPRGIKIRIAICGKFGERILLGIMLQISVLLWFYKGWHEIFKRSRRRVYQNN